MNQKPEGNFLDSRTIMAIVLVGVIFYGWQKYLSEKYPDYYKPKPAAEKTATPSPEAAAPAPEKAVPSQPTTAAETAQTLPPKEEFVSYENTLVSFELSNLGMAIHNLTLKDYLDTDKKPVQFGTKDVGPLFSTSLLGSAEPLPFNIERTSENEFVGRARVGESTVTKTLRVYSDTGKIETSIRVEKPAASMSGLMITSHMKKSKNTGGSFFMPSLDHQEFVYRKDGKTEHVRADSDSEDVSEKADAVTMVAMSSQYFTTAIADHSSVLPSVELEAPKDQPIKSRVSYRILNPGQDLEIKYVAYAGGKSVNRLESVDPEFSEIVNLGIFASIGRVLLKVLHMSYALVGNWGWAIVILTILVRLLVLPFNIASYRSMKKMQAIQPYLQSIRERYKDDPATLNRESMAIMREHKVNPLGGCLPMLLQMPVFFALYQVLGQSIELYQAPFILWINDLSLKDPFYILPILMGLVMFIQQKMTPTGTMDPNQARILQWMPVLFSIFMLGLPSGLTLYIFVSTLFSVIQQKIFMRDRSKKTPAVVDVKAQRVH